MNLSEVREVIRQVILEVKKEGGLPKSGGKLVHLKKELNGLRKMKESLGQYAINENGENPSSFVAEYAHMQKFVNELEKIKVAHAKLSEMLDNQISEVEGKVASETEKIKEMVGLIEKAPVKPTKKDKKPKEELEEVRGDKGRQHSAKSKDYGEEYDYTPKTDYRVDQKFHHKKYGTGTITKVDPVSPVTQAKEGAKIYVKFPDGNKIISVKTLKPQMRENLGCEECQYDFEDKVEKYVNDNLNVGESDVTPREAKDIIDAILGEFKYTDYENNDAKLESDITDWITTYYDEQDWNSGSLSSRGLSWSDFIREAKAKKKKPSAGMTKKEKSAVATKARAGKDIGKKGKGFEKVAAAAGGGEKGKKIAAAAMWKGQAKK
jgi:hypothetical protein